MSARTCASCGAAVGELAARCPSCGADPDVRLIELGGAAGTHPRREDRRPVPAPRRPAGRSWRRWAPVGIAAAVVWGAFVVTADDPAGEVDRAVAAPTSTAGATSAPDATPATTTTLVVPGAPLFGESVGFQMAFVSESTRVVDPETGHLRSIPRAHVIGVTDAGLILTTPQLVVWPPPYDGDGEIVLADAPVQQVWVGGDGRTVWSVRWGFEPEIEEIARHDVVAGTSGTYVLDPVAWPAGAVGDSLVVRAPGGTYLMGPDGGIDRVSSGEVVTTGGDWLLVRTCDDRLACELEVLDSAGRVLRTHPEFTYADTGPSGPIGPEPGVGPYPVFAVDGRVAALRSGGGDGVAVTVDGEVVARLLEPGAMCWSPDGRWLLVMDGRQLVAIDTSTTVEPLRLDLQLRARAVWAVVTFPSAR